METYKVLNIRGHLEVYLNGQFICSGDNETEICEEIKEYESNKN